VTIHHKVVTLQWNGNCKNQFLHSITLLVNISMQCYVSIFGDTWWILWSAVKHTVHADNTNQINIHHTAARATTTTTTKCTSLSCHMVVTWLFGESLPPQTFSFPTGLILWTLSDHLMCLFCSMAGFVCTVC